MSPTTFPSTVTARQIQRDYKSVFAKAKKSASPIVVISNNQPQAAIISIENMNEYLEYKNKEQLWKTIASIQADNPNTNEQEVEADVLAAIKRVRMNRYDKTARRSR